MTPSRRRKTWTTTISLSRRRQLAPPPRHSLPHSLMCILNYELPLRSAPGSHNANRLSFYLVAAWAAAWVWEKNGYDGCGCNCWHCRHSSRPISQSGGREGRGPDWPVCERSRACRLIQLLRRPLISRDAIVHGRWWRRRRLFLAAGSMDPGQAGSASSLHWHACSRVLTLINVKRNLVACVWIYPACARWKTTRKLPVCDGIVAR